jgi:hypothetical protein
MPAKTTTNLTASFKKNSKQRPKGWTRTTTPKRKEAFLKQLRKIPNISLACNVLKIQREVAYAWRNTDLEFKEKWDKALLEGLDNLEGRAMQRAYTKSDYLMDRMLRAHIPKYREQLDMKIRTDAGVRALLDAVAQVFTEYIPADRLSDAVIRLRSLTGVGRTGYLPAEVADRGDKTNGSPS